MKKALICGAALVLVLAMVAPAFAVPWWWDLNPLDPNYPNWREKSGILTYENISGGGGASGTLDVSNIPNVDNPLNYKLLYLVADWSVVPDPGQNGNMGAVLLDWPGHPTPVQMNPVIGSGPHREYEYMIPIQPPSENLHFSFSGVDLGEKITIDYELQTICFPRDHHNVPEPGVLALLTGGLFGLIRKRRS